MEALDLNNRMPPKIAILGWGSLLWDGGMHFDRWHSEWRFDGPSLKLEFSRISTSRLGALTLVIDAQHGVINTVAWSRSLREHVVDTIEDLRRREGTEIKNIRSLVVADPLHEDESSRAVSTWAAERKLDVVVWTGLTCNFKSKLKDPFSVEAAVAYLRKLPPAAKVKAAEYFWRAPEFIRTPLRSAIQTEPWFSLREGA